jgi:uncharacterized repeat protein (TIGR02543 family)
VTVKDTTVPVSGVAVNPTSLTLQIGKTATGKLTAVVWPTNASNKKVIWSSNNTKTATVDGNGNVTAKSAGNAVITVKTVDGGYTAQCSVTVKGTPRKYSIKYVLNGGKNDAGNPTAYYEGTAVAINPATREGARFIAWYDNAKFSGSPITSTVNRTGNLTLYAKWELREYNIYYDYGYFEPVKVSNPEKYNITSTVTFKNPTRKGYDCLGWYEYGNKITGIKKGTTGEKYLTAGWREHGYTLKLAANGGKGQAVSYKLNYTESVKLPGNPYTNPGYNFKGWLDKSTGIVYKPNDAVSMLTEKNNGTYTLYAQWEAIEYKINHAVNGGTMPVGYPTVHTYAKAVKLVNPVKTGYDFAGWFETRDFTGKKLTSIPAKQARAYTLYAKWTPINYKILFNANKGKGKTAAINNVLYGTSVTLTANGFTKTGYSFAGWATTAERAAQGIVDYRDGQIVRNLRNTKGNVTLYAVWK